MKKQDISKESLELCNNMTDIFLSCMKETGDYIQKNMERCRLSGENLFEFVYEKVLETEKLHRELYEKITFLGEKKAIEIAGKKYLNWIQLVVGTKKSMLDWDKANNDI